MAKNIASEENNVCGGYGCGSDMRIMCKHGSFKHHILKKIFWTFLLVLVFCLGVQFGELRGTMKVYSRYGGMMGWGERGGFRSDWSDNRVNTPIAPTSTTQTTPEVKTTTPKQ